MSVRRCWSATSALPSTEITIFFRRLLYSMLCNLKHKCNLYWGAGTVGFPKLETGEKGENDLDIWEMH